MSEFTLEVADKLVPVGQSNARYKILYGGRGGSKSWFFAQLAIARGYNQELSIVCLRQFQSSIRDSVHELLSKTIKRMGLESFYTVQENRITGKNGTDIIFKGLAKNINNIKSMEDKDIAWITEAVDVSEEAWVKLKNTIRKPGSEIWMDFNPEEESDPVYNRYVLNPPKNSIVVKINYDENPFFKNTTLVEEMEYDKEYNPDEFNNIWLGECQKTSDAQIMKGKWEVKEFETPKDAYFYYGSDWGNSGLGDPDTILRCFIEDGNIYIDEEAKDNIMYIEDYIPFYTAMKESKDFVIRCDNTMAKFRRHLNGHGFRLKDAVKGPGSIDSGIKHIRSFKRIYIHPRCKNTIFEFRNYKYKTDPRTGEVSRIIIDKHNHFIDSLRYALEGIMRHNSQKQKRPDKNLTQLLGW